MMPTVIAIVDGIWFVKDMKNENDELTVNSEKNASRAEKCFLMKLHRTSRNKGGRAALNTFASNIPLKPAFIRNDSMM